MAVPTAVLTAVPANHAFGQVALGAQVSVAVQVNNTGTKAATVVGINTVFPPYSINGSNCSGTIAIGGHCNFVLHFKPTAVGNFNLAGQVHYNNGIGNVVAGFAASGTGKAVTPPLANLVFSNAPKLDFGNAVVGAHVDHAITFTNNGTGAGNVTGLTASAPFSVASNTCIAILAPGASCTVTLRFAPTAVGAAAGNVQVNYQTAGQNKSAVRALAGNGTVLVLPPANFTISSAPAFAYGSHPIGSTTAHVFTIKNIGTITGVFNGTNVGAPFSLTGNTCGANLAGGASCTMQVSFTPTAAGNFNSAFQIHYKSGPTALLASINVSGSATGLPVLSFVGAPFNFGPVQIGQVAVHAIQLSNTGNGSATNLSFNSSGPFQILGKTCGFILPAGGSCQVTVRFQPAFPGPVGGSLDAHYHDTNGPKAISASLKGVGLSQAVLSFNTPGVDFGSVPQGTSRAATLVLFNSGTGAAALQNMGTNVPFLIAGSSCGSFLPAGGSCAISVVFAPSAAIPAAGNLSVGYYDGSVSRVVTANLIGVGLAPANVLVSDAPVLDFGSVTSGVSADRSVTVSNIGQVTASFSAITVGAPFVVSANGCGAILAPGASCAVTIRFRPTTAGEFDDTLVVNYGDGTTAQSTTRAVRGVSAAAAVLSAVDGAAFDFGAVVVGGQATHVFTLSNGSLSTIGGLQAPTANAPFSVRGSTCGASLAAGATCAVTVVFSPVAAGAAADALSVAYGSGTLQIALAGTGSTLAGFDGAVNAVAVEDDGSLYVGGDFTSYRGQNAGHLVRLRVDGTLDPAFAVGTGFDQTVEAIALVPGTSDIVVGGKFTQYAGLAAGSLVRLRGDGTTNTSFDTRQGFDGEVRALAAAVDGSGAIYVGGDFASYRGGAVGKLVRLGADGSLDGTFSATAIAGRVNALLVDSGKVVVAGGFAGGLRRLNVDGSTDGAFNGGTGFDGEAYALTSSGDGSGTIYVGGEFQSYQGAAVRGAARLAADGSLDGSFQLAADFSGRVNALSLVIDDGGAVTQVYVGGAFRAAGVNNLLRTDVSGTVDPTFAPAVDGTVAALTNEVDTNGTRWQVIGGAFTNLNGTVVNRLAILGTDGRARN